MSIEGTLIALQPRRKDKVFDLVESLGFDMSDWIATASNPQKVKANPKYCYDWSFIVPRKLAIFNLWHEAMRIEGSDIVYRENFRKNADYHRAHGGKSQWIVRGQKLDRDAAEAARDNLPVRVIIVDGWRRETENPSSDSSHVRKRQLDAFEWHVHKYDARTGDFVLVRGPGASQYVDQFDLAELDPKAPTRREVSRSAFDRDPEVRRAALRRANGKCEYCGGLGFTMANGRIYLETHHIIALCDGGSDHIRNVVALCPNDHRRAHFGKERNSMRDELIKVIAG